MNETEIRKLVLSLDTKNQIEADEAWGKLKPLGIKVVPYLAEA